MSKTIELLELIGQDASWRHVVPAEKSRRLEALQASDGVRQVVASGDKVLLLDEIGHRHSPMHVNHNPGGGEPDEHDSEQVPVRPDGDTPAPSPDHRD